MHSSGPRQYSSDGRVRTPRLRNVISPQLVRCLTLKKEETTKVVTLMNCKKSGVIGKVTNVLVFFEQLEARMEFFVLENVPFDLVIGRPTMKRFGGVLDFRAEEVRLDYGGQTAALPMVAKYSQSQLDQDGTDSEDFTSDWDGDIAVSEGKGGEEELLLVTVDDNGGIQRCQEVWEAVYKNAVTSEELNKRLFHPQKSSQSN